MTIDRIPSKYSNRLRRAVAQAKRDSESNIARLVELEAAGSSMSYDYAQIDIDGNDNETVSNPTAAGQWLVRAINKITAAGTYTVFGRFLEYPTGSIETQAETSSDFTVFVAISVQSGDTWTWFVVQGGGWIFSAP